ncbi:MAG: pyridoxal phosphate-dependent aminotransferase [bacterium]
MIIPAANRLNQVEEYYFSQKLKEVRALAQQGMKVINLGIGNPDLPPSPATIEELTRSARQEQNHGYQPYRGTDALRQALAEWYQQTYGVALDPDAEVLPLMGSKEGIFFISQAFLNPGDQVLVPDPGYPGYAATARLAGAKPIFYPLSEASGWLPALHELSRMDLSQVKIMWLNYPHMPTGVIATEADLRNLVDFARKRSILLCHDNPYSLVLNPQKPLSILKIDGAMENCLELNSLSKSFNLAGWRVGMVMGQAAYLDAIVRVKSNMDSGQFLPIQLAAVQALKNPPEWHQTRNQRLAKRKKLVKHLFDLMNFQYQSQTAGMFVWAKAPDEIASVESYLDDLLHATGIFLTPGRVFGEKGRRYARASICADEARLEEAGSRIQRYLNQRH